MENARIKKVIIINGPNLNMLGTREPEIYGKETLDDIKSMCEKEAGTLGLELTFTQSNSEDEIINQIQDARAKYDAIIINAAAYTHTSVAIFDALSLVDIPIIEVHLSNIYKREEFRHKSFISPVAKGVICGFGADSYRLALKSLC